MKRATSVIFSFTVCLASQVAFAELTPEATEYKKDIDYQHHILVVDEDGSALVPIVNRSLAKDGTYRYRASHKKLDGEETREAKVNSALLKGVGGPSNDKVALKSQQMRIHFGGRYLRGPRQSIITKKIPN
jgi:hypothetical protein